MANPQRGEVAFEIDGRTYTLALGINAMCEIEAVLSTEKRRVRFREIAESLTEFDATYLRAFFWGALRRHHGEIELADVEPLIDACGGYIPFVGRFMPVAAQLIDHTKPDKRDRAVLKEAGAGSDRPNESDPAITTGTRGISKRAKSA